MAVSSGSRLKFFPGLVAVHRVPQSGAVNMGVIRLKGTAMSRVILEGYIVVPENDLAAVSAELATHIELTRKEEGCLQFDVAQTPFTRHRKCNH